MDNDVDLVPVINHLCWSLTSFLFFLSAKLKKTKKSTYVTVNLKKTVEIEKKTEKNMLSWWNTGGFLP